MEKSKLTAAFLKRKMAEYEALKLEIARLQQSVDALHGEPKREQS